MHRCYVCISTLLVSHSGCILLCINVFLVHGQVLKFSTSPNQVRFVKYLLGFIPIHCNARMFPIKAMKPQLNEAMMAMNWMTHRCICTVKFNYANIITIRIGQSLIHWIKETWDTMINNLVFCVYDYIYFLKSRFKINQNSLTGTNSSYKLHNSLYLLRILWDLN